MSAVVFATADAVSTAATVVLPVVVVPALDRTTAFPVAVVHVAPTAVDATVIEAVATMIKVVAVVVDIVVVIIVAAVIIFDDTVIVVAATVVVTVVTVFDNVIAVIPAAVVVIVDVADAVIYAVATTTTDERRWSFAVYVREATA